GDVLRRGLELPIHTAKRVVELQALLREELDALRQLVVLPLRPVAIDLDAACAVLDLPLLTLRVLDREPERCDRLARAVLASLAVNERRTRRRELRLELCALGCRVLAIRGDARAIRFAFGRLELRTLSARQRVSLALFGHRHLAAKLLNELALRRH